jgi:hypothetical protein
MRTGVNGQPSSVAVTRPDEIEAAGEIGRREGFLGHRFVELAAIIKENPELDDE